MWPVVAASASWFIMLANRQVFTSMKYQRVGSANFARTVVDRWGRWLFERPHSLVREKCGKHRLIIGFGKSLLAGS
jgi:hypothetical protein